MHRNSGSAYQYDSDLKLHQSRRHAAVLAQMEAQRRTHRTTNIANPSPSMAATQSIPPFGGVGAQTMPNLKAQAPTSNYSQMPKKR